MHTSHFNETIAGYTVEINAIPLQRYDFGGFGWNLRVTGETLQETMFTVTIECATKQDDDVRNNILEIGRTLVQQLLSQRDPRPHNQYCYNWHPDGGPIEVHCDKRPEYVAIV